MTLAWVYAHHAEELEADIASEYGVILEDEDEVSTTSLRKLWVWYNQLPKMNRVTKAILLIPGEETWDHRDALLVDLIDCVNYGTYVLMQANSKQKVKQPKPYPRPDYGKKLRQQQDPTPKRNRLPGQVKYVPKGTPKEEV